MSEQLHGHQEIDGQLLLGLITKIGANMQLYRQLSRDYPQVFGKELVLMESETTNAYQTAETVLKASGLQLATWDHELIGQGSGRIHDMVFTAAEGQCTFMMVPDGKPFVRESVVGVPVTAVTDLVVRNF